MEFRKSGCSNIGGIYVLLDTYVAVFLWIMALFGIITLAINVISTVIRPVKGRGAGYSIVITVEKDRDDIEGIIRWLILKDQAPGRGGTFNEIVVVDKGATDDTLRILSRLARQYPCLKVVKPEDLKGVLT